MCVLCCTAVNVIYTRLTCRVQQKCDLYSATRSCHCNILTRQKVTQFIATKAMGIMPDMAIHMTSFVYKTAWLEMCKTEAAADLSCWSWQFCQFIMAGDQLCWYNDVSWCQLRNQFCSLQCTWNYSTIMLFNQIAIAIAYQLTSNRHYVRQPLSWPWHHHAVCAVYGFPASCLLLHLAFKQSHCTPLRLESLLLTSQTSQQV